jgi:hypothetical protein
MTPYIIGLAVIASLIWAHSKFDKFLKDYNKKINDETVRKIIFGEDR